MRLCWRVEWPSAAMSAVAVKLADCANDEGENVYPSVGRIERETRLGASTVRRVLEAFQQAGILEIVAEASGNRWGRSTTIRRYNVAILHDLAAVEVRRDRRVLLAPSTHVIKQVRAPGCQVEEERRRRAEQRRADGKPTRLTKDAVVCDCCPWTVVVRGPGDVSDYQPEDTPPLPEREGCDNPAPPGAGGDPSRSGSPTPPGAGGNPSVRTTIEDSPLPPKGGERAGLDELPLQDGSGTVETAGLRSSLSVATGWARGWTHPARNAVLAMLADPATAPVALVLLERVRGTLRPAKGADPVAFVGELARRLAGTPGEVLARVGEQMIATRGEYLPAAPVIADAADRARVELLRETEARMRLAAGATGGDPEVAARRHELRAALIQQLGHDTVAAWFDSAVPHRLAAGVLTLAVESQFHETWIRNNYERAMLAAAQRAFGMVSRVDVVAVQRLAASRPAGEAAA